MYKIMVNGNRYKFELSDQEILKMEFESLPNTRFSDFVKHAVADLNIEYLGKAFEIIILRSFKGPGTREDFANSNDFKCLFRRLYSNPRRTKNFMTHILPANYEEIEAMKGE